MPESVFHFKQFSVRQDLCAMKVGTDGVLLGSWINPPAEGKILDIGTGTGLIALMAAQKSNAFIDAIDIDRQACEQAEENTKQSPWENRIRVVHSSLMDFRPVHRYDLIVSNPPYFIDSCAPEDEARHLARSASASLNQDELINGVVRLLHISGRFCVILPQREGHLFLEKAEQNGLFCNIQVNVRTGLEKPCKRVLMEFSRQEDEPVIEELVLHTEGREFTDQYKQLTRDFYLAF